jgi:hypothetical protein
MTSFMQLSQATKEAVAVIMLATPRRLDFEVTAPA